MRKPAAFLLATAIAACSAGQKGDLGPAGSEGPTGPQGPGGPTGQTGTPGERGGPGPTGPTGASVTTLVLDPGDANCPAGGLKITGPSGLVYLCNGLGGATGAKGDPGVSVTATALTVGDATCGNGGVKLQTATNTTYVCNGAKGASGTAGTTGATGGTGASGLTGATGATGSFSGTFAGDATIQGNLGVTGSVTVGGALGVTGNLTVGGALGVTGNLTVGGALGVTGNLTVGGSLGVTGDLGVSGTLTAATLSVTNLKVSGASRVKLSDVGWCGTDFATRLTTGGTVAGNFNAVNNSNCVNGSLPGTDATAICGAGGWHPCTAWEAMVIEEISSDSPFTQAGWLVGSFPNIDYHLRSLVNGQNTVVCPARDPAAAGAPNNAGYLFKYPSTFNSNGITTPGGIHCGVETALQNVWCCKNR
jgi:collagen type VII alpha